MPSAFYTPDATLAAGAMPAAPAVAAPALRSALRTETLPLAIALVAFASLSLWAAVASEGFLDDDACTHYLYARFAFNERYYLTDVWGRPFVTMLYALPAWSFGRLGVRVLSMLLAAATALVTFDVARRQGLRRPSLAAIFVLAQPLFFLHSFAELTEVPFAFLAAAALWAYQRRQWSLLGLIAGLMPTARPEGFGFMALAAGAIVLHRRDAWMPALAAVGAAVVLALVHLAPTSGPGWAIRPQLLPVALAFLAGVALGFVFARRAWWLALMAAPLLAWSIAGWYTNGGYWHGDWLLRILLWIPEHWPYTAASAYRAGWLVHFLVLLPAVVGPFAFPAVLLGMWLFCSQPRDRGAGGTRSGIVARAASALFGGDHAVRCDWVIALIPAGLLVGHSLLYWRGWLASNGELRYLLVVTPFWGLLAAAGWAWAFHRFRLRGMVPWAGAAALFPILVNLVYPIVPVRPTDDWPQARQASVWYMGAREREAYPRLMTSHRALNYLLDVSPTDNARAAEFSHRAIVSPPPGVILIWDPRHGASNADRDLTAELNDILKAGWVPVRGFRQQEGRETVHPWAAMDALARKLDTEERGTWWAFLSPSDRFGNPTPPPATRPSTLPVIVPGR